MVPSELDGIPRDTSASGERERRAFGVIATILTPAEWFKLRSIRLRALRESPEAFGSDYAREAAWSAEQWLSTFDSALWFVARSRHRPVGLARSAHEPGRPAQRNVESVWVEPGFRRRGVTRLLIERLTAHERRAGATELLAWVLDGNDNARRVYTRLGFEPTEERQPFPGGHGRTEERLRLRISR